MTNVFEFCDSSACSEEESVKSSNSGPIRFVINCSRSYLIVIGALVVVVVSSVGVDGGSRGGGGDGGGCGSGRIDVMLNG